MKLKLLIAVILLALSSWASVNTSTSTQVTITVSQQGAAHDITLTWTASTTTDVTGYNVYISNVSGGPYTLLATFPTEFYKPIGNVLTYTDTQQKGTYYYVATAYDSLGGESNYSNEVQAVVP